MYMILTTLNSHELCDCTNWIDWDASDIVTEKLYDRAFSKEESPLNDSRGGQSYDAVYCM